MGRARTALHSSGWSAAGIVVMGAVMGAAIAPTTGFASDLPTPAAAQAASVPADRTGS